MKTFYTLRKTFVFTTTLTFVLLQGYTLLVRPYIDEISALNCALDESHGKTQTLTEKLSTTKLEFKQTKELNKTILTNQKSLLTQNKKMAGTIDKVKAALSKTSSSAKTSKKRKLTDYEITKGRKTRKSKGKNYFKETPFKNYEEFIIYWMKYDGIKPFVEKHNLPARTILTRMWTETNGGILGSAGKQGALFAIKAVDGDEVIYAKDDKYIKGKKVYSKFKKYKTRSGAISHFCAKLTNPNKMYKQRFDAWKKVHPRTADWKLWALAMQVHPQLSKSRYAYATQNVEQYNKKSQPAKYRHMKTHKKISPEDFYKIRKSSATRSIELTMKYDEVFKKYGY